MIQYLEDSWAQDSGADKSAQFLYNRAFCEESTILTGCVDFYTNMNIRYRGICEIKNMEFLTF